MPFEYFEVTAEVGIRAWGTSFAEAFGAASLALFGLMVETDAVEPKQKSVAMTMQNDSLEVLLADWLNHLITERDRMEFVFSRFNISIHMTAASLWELTGYAWGESLDRQRHDPRIDVKAVTYNNLRCYSQSEVFFVECVLDI